MTVNAIIRKVYGHEITLLSMHGLPYNADMYEKDGKIYDAVTEKCISDFKVDKIIATGAKKLAIFIKEK